MVTRMLAAGQEDEEIRNSGILYLSEQDEKRLLLEPFNIIKRSKPLRIGIINLRIRTKRTSTKMTFNITTFSTSKKLQTSKISTTRRRIKITTNKTKSTSFAQIIKLN